MKVLDVDNAGRIDRLKDTFAGGRCFILGNGPSLKEMDLGLLKSEHVFVSNWFNLHPIYPELQNPWYLVSDVAFWNPEKELTPRFLEGVIRNPTCRTVFNSAAEPALGQSTSFGKDLERIIRETIYLNFDRSQPVWEGNFHVDLHCPLAFGYTVVIDFGLPMAFHLGFKDVYLIGCDCDYRLHEDRDFSKSYFFDLKEMPPKNLEHLRHQRDTKGSQQKTNVWNQGYAVARKYFEGHGRNLVNAGYGGRLEALPRTSFEELFR